MRRAALDTLFAFLLNRPSAICREKDSPRKSLCQESGNLPFLSNAPSYLEKDVPLDAALNIDSEVKNGLRETKRVESECPVYDLADQFHPRALAYQVYHLALHPSTTMDQLPESFPPNYKPSTHIAELSASAPIEEILSVIDRDGGVILNNLVSGEELTSIEKELERYVKTDREDDEGFFKGLVPQETVLLGGLVGKSDTLAKVCEHKVLEELRREILTDHGTRRVEQYDLPYHIDPLLSVSLSFRIRYGAVRQRLHRDDGTHLVEHDSKPYRLNHAAQLGCLIAGVETTQANGATMFIPGSHRWDDKREPRLDEVTFAGWLLLPDLRYSDAADISDTAYRDEARCSTHLSRVLLAWRGP